LITYIENEIEVDFAHLYLIFRNNIKLTILIQYSHEINNLISEFTDLTKNMTLLLMKELIEKYVPEYKIEENNNE